MPILQNIPIYRYFRIHQYADTCVRTLYADTCVRMIITTAVFFMLVWAYWWVVRVNLWSFQAFLSGFSRKIKKRFIRTM